jgi:hypothetical protein
VTFTWEALADTARIDRISPQGTVVESFSVVPSGQLPVTLPTAAGPVVYRLTAQRAGGEVSSSLTIQVQLACPIPWFFGTENALPESGCPVAGPVSVTGKSQLFERGLMFNLLIGGQDRVYGLNSGNNRYMVYQNNWDGSTVHSSTCGTAPDGLHNPQDVFNWAYHTTLGTVGLWCAQNVGIGWGLGPPTLGNTLTYQFEANGVAFYINVPGYGVVRISGQPTTGSWRRIS